MLPRESLVTTTFKVVKNLEKVNIHKERERKNIEMNSFLTGLNERVKSLEDIENIDC